MSNSPFSWIAETQQPRLPVYLVHILDVFGIYCIYNLESTKDDEETLTSVVYILSR